MKKQLSKTKFASTKALEKKIQNLKNLEEKVEHLAKEYEKFKMAVDGVSDHVVITDPEGIILYANKAAEKVTGYSRKEMLGAKAGRLWGGLMGKPFYQKMWHQIKIAKKPYEGLIKNKRKNNELYDAAVKISPILNHRGDPVFFVGLERDVTAEKAVDRAKTEFVSLASHQLRTPLTAIKWYGEMLLKGKAGDLNKKQREYLGEVTTGNERMIALVNSLLNLSRIEMGSLGIDPKPTDVCGLISMLAKEYQSLADEKNITLECTCRLHSGKVKLDVLLTRFIVQNLLSNAIKYTPNSGKVEVVVESRSPYFEISVSDNGCGIPLHQQSKIFTKFFRADNVVPKDPNGSGLGLYIAKSIIEAVGGKIWFESEENKGSTFYVRIPLTGMKTKTGKKIIY